MTEEILVSREAAEEILTLYRSLTAADQVYRSCQDRQFRQFARACMEAKNVEAAFRTLAEGLGEKPEG